MKTTIAMQVEHLLLSVLFVAAIALVASTMALMVTAHPGTAPAAPTVVLAP